MEGEVEIGIDGESVTLRPSLGAAMALNQEFGSFGGLLSELEAYNLGAAIKVVKRAGEFHDEERIFKTGLVEITPSLIRFVIMLANGGKPLAESGEDQGDGPFGGSPTPSTSATSSSGRPAGSGGRKPTR